MQSPGAGQETIQTVQCGEYRSLCPWSRVSGLEITVQLLCRMSLPLVIGCGARRRMATSFSRTPSRRQPLSLHGNGTRPSSGTRAAQAMLKPGGADRGLLGVSAPVCMAPGVAKGIQWKAQDPHARFDAGPAVMRPCVLQGCQCTPKSSQCTLVPGGCTPGLRCLRPLPLALGSPGVMGPLRTSGHSARSEGRHSAALRQDGADYLHATLAGRPAASHVGREGTGWEYET